mmetsp:Transcript_81840/g.171171  ORF Transcript_81840/g.171171 Transcript_81840/m.171171 type:complete len:382 (-) Transcript_81840:1214-2359(-)
MQFDQLVGACAAGQLEPSQLDANAGGAGQLLDLGTLLLELRPGRIEGDLELVHPGDCAPDLLLDFGLPQQGFAGLSQSLHSCCCERLSGCDHGLQFLEDVVGLHEQFVALSLHHSAPQLLELVSGLLEALRKLLDILLQRAAGLRGKSADLHELASDEAVGLGRGFPCRSQLLHNLFQRRGLGRLGRVRHLLCFHHLIGHLLHHGLGCVLHLQFLGGLARPIQFVLGSLGPLLELREFGLEELRGRLPLGLEGLVELRGELLGGVHGVLEVLEDFRGGRGGCCGHHCHFFHIDLEAHHLHAQVLNLLSHFQSLVVGSPRSHEDVEPGLEVLEAILHGEEFHHGRLSRLVRKRCTFDEVTCHILPRRCDGMLRGHRQAFRVR